jgi:hypothetical protein
MITPRFTLVLLAGTALLAACGKSGQPAAPASAAPPSAAPASAAPESGGDTVITAAQLPVPKAGYWETTTTSNGGAPEVSHTCQSGKPIDPKLGHSCANFTIKRTFTGAYVIDGACSENGVSSSMHITVQGDFLGGGYTSDGKGSVTVPNHGTMEFNTHSVSKYVGPCPAGSEASG